MSYPGRTRSSVLRHCTQLNKLKPNALVLKDGYRVGRGGNKRLIYELDQGQWRVLEIARPGEALRPTAVGKVLNDTDELPFAELHRSHPVFISIHICKVVENCLRPTSVRVKLTVARVFSAA